MRFPSLFFLLVVAVAGQVSAAEAIAEKRLDALFRPASGERLALSADGRFMAHTQHAAGELLIIVTDLERRVVTARISADEDRPILHSKEKRRARLRYLEWAAGHRLVFAPEVEIIAPAVRTPPPDVFVIEFPADQAGYQVPPLPPTVIAPIMAVDFDGKNPRELADAKTFQTQRTDPNSAALPARPRRVAPVIRGFAAGDRTHLLVEIPGATGSGIAPDIVPTTLYRIHVATGKISELRSEPGEADLIYDAGARARIAREPGAGQTITYRVRAPESGRWLSLPAPPGAAPAAAAFAVTPGSYFGERAIPLGFDRDPHVLIYAANLGRDTFGVYGLDLRTRARTPLSLEHPEHDLVPLDAMSAAAALVIDRHRHTFAGVRVPGSRPLTVWADPELAEAQRAAEAHFPGRSVELRDWDEARARFLVQATGGLDPGRLFQFRRAEGLMTELMRTAPWLPAASLHVTMPIELGASDGARLTGFLTLPRSPRLNPPPLIVWFAPGLPPQPHPEFDAQAQVLADLGFVVCRLNQRGTAGQGLRHREALGRDPAGAPAADALTAIAWIAERHAIDRTRVVALGEGLAGHFALRAAQLHPEAFRCVAVFDPILHLRAWLQPPADAAEPASFAQEANRLFLEGRGARLAEAAVTAHPNALQAPVFVASRGDRHAAIDTLVATGIAQLRAQLGRRGVPFVELQFNTDFAEGLPAARARVYRALEQFLNLHLYDYDVKIGPAKVVK